MRISAINLGVMLLLVIAPSMIRDEHGYPLGYRVVVLLAAFYGIFVGTDSFTLPMGAKMAPSLAVLGRSGPYEVAAYVLAVAATSPMSRYRLVGRWPKQTAERIAPDRREQPFWRRYGAVAMAILLLLAACAWEA